MSEKIKITQNEKYEIIGIIAMARHYQKKHIEILDVIKEKYGEHAFNFAMDDSYEEETKKVFEHVFELKAKPK